jgi:phosphoribosyl 1,2-cyclic phosphodiesterase
MSVQFAVLASGSQGNATLIQAGGAGMLLDVGLGPRALGGRLESVGASLSRVASALLTHTHGDHVNNLTLHRMERHRTIFYCHEGHRTELSRRSGFRALERTGLVRYFDERPFLTPAGFRVEPVELRHDGPTFGFRIEAKPPRGRSTVALGYMADTGSWSDDMADILAEVDVLGVEFNHDVEMQRRSNRPAMLIARNLGDRGHLSNDQGAEFVNAVIDRSGSRAPRYVVLLHLSQQCNHPDLALRAARRALRATGRRIAVHAAEQASAAPNILLGPARRRAVATTRRQATARAATGCPLQGL